VRLSAAGEGGSKVIAEEPQAVFKEKTKKHETFLKKQQNQWVEAYVVANKNSYRTPKVPKIGAEHQNCCDSSHKSGRDSGKRGQNPTRARVDSAA
ncbi:hypothetical protein, partial [Thalassobius sp. Cn5-15]|uniref:hypothetical protein n=1 Tax=Thalassobius sp. Cn5-15 TaxID=2917763 RepID=UPI001EF20BC7